MDNNKLHIQFDKDNKYIGKVDSAHEIIAGHYNVEVSHDEHEDIEKNKDNADHIASIIGTKQKITNEATYPLFGDSDLDTVNQKIKKHGRNPDTVKQGETVHVFTHRGEHGFAQVHYDPSLDKYKVLGKSNSKKGVHAKYFDKDSDAHAHAKDWVKNSIHEMENDLLELSKQTLANYIKNASYDVLRRSSDKASAASKTTTGIFTGDKEREEAGSKERDEIHDKMLNRTSNINKAVNKLTKEDLDEGKFDLVSMANDHKKLADAAKENMYTARDKFDRDDFEHEYKTNMLQHHALMYKHHDENGDQTLATQHKQEYEKFKGKKMNESFGATILDSIINNKPIQAQEQFGLAMANVIKSKIDDMRQEVAKDIFNKVNEE